MTESQKQLLGTAPDSVIAEKLGLSCREVRETRIAEGIAPYRKHTPKNEARDAQIRSLYAAVQSFAAVAKQVSLSRERVRQIVRGKMND